ncbi:MAG: sulfite exporter TauE/SafE family protein [Dehalococcoidia bacterium]|nr:sulfite exporter TauE/SafE family protein [Dehalococcoidia bacterium]
MPKTTVPIRGMHCRACELAVEDEIVKIGGVRRATADAQRGVVAIDYATRTPPMDAIANAIRRAGYEVGERGPTPLLNADIRAWRDAGVTAIGVIAALWWWSQSGLLNLAPVGGAEPNYAVVGLIGLAAGVSTCMALVGGLALGVSARFAEQRPDLTAAERFTPHLFFTAGRWAAFFVFGGLIGQLGQVVQLSPLALGALMIVAGLVMLLLGLQLTTLLPRLRTVSVTLPKGISRLLGVSRASRGYSHRSAAAIGAATFFLPCGFTQAMQLYAVTTGSFIAGGLTMLVFAIGSTPGLLSIGGLTAVMTGSRGRAFFRVAGVVVVILAFVNIANGYVVAGGVVPDLPPFGGGSPSAVGVATLRDGVQVVTMTQHSGGYTPNVLTVQVGVPVRWEITSTDSVSCAASLVSQPLNVRKLLDRGQNVIEFTPTQVGVIPFSCSMGMYTGRFQVVEKLPS